MATIEAEKKYTLGEAALGFVGIALIAPMALVATFPITMVCAWCDMKLWNWFAAPYLHLQPMPFWIALGIGLWVSLQRGREAMRENDKKVRFWAGMFSSLAGHLITLLIGYLVYTHYVAGR